MELIPFGYYTEGDGTVAAPSDSLLNDSTAVPPPTKSEVKPESKPEVKVKLKANAEKKVRSASKAGLKRLKNMRDRAEKAVVEMKSEAAAAAKPAETPKPAETAPAKASAPAPAPAQ